MRGGGILSVVDHGLRDVSLGRLDVVKLGQLGFQLSPVLGSGPSQLFGGFLGRMLKLGLGLVVHLPLNGSALACRGGNGVLDLGRELVEVFFVEAGQLRFDQLVHFGANVFGLLVPYGALGRQLAAVLGRFQAGVIFDAGIGEESLQSIVILVEDGIELVIVAARAAIGHAKE